MLASRVWVAARVAAVAIAVLFGGGRGARADVLALYNFENFGPVPGAPNLTAALSADTDPNSTASGFTFDETGVGESISQTFGSPPPAYTALTTVRNLGEAKTAGAYHRLTLTPSPGYALDLQTMSSDLSVLAASGGPGPLSVSLSVFSSVDNFLNPVHFNLAADANRTDTLPGPTSSVTSPSMSLDPQFRSIATPVEFRLYYYGDAAYDVVDNIRINGTATPVPEPGAALVVVGGLLVSLRARRRP